MSFAVQIHSIRTGDFRLDGGAMFGVVTKVIWQALWPPDADNRILLALRALLLRRGDRAILVDTGIGDWHEEKFYSIYGIQPRDFDFREALRKYSLTPDEITDVILTHLHFDHAGGLIRRGAGGLEPTFPNASLHIQRRQYDWAQRPSVKDRASYLKPMMDYLSRCGQIVFHDGEGPLTEEISLAVFEGHTPALQTVLIRQPEQTVFFTGDWIPTSRHFHIPYLTAYELQPLKQAEEKRDILERAARENWLLYFQHDPECIAGRVGVENGKFVCVPEGSS